jgi:hypothetical protein
MRRIAQDNDDREEGRIDRWLQLADQLLSTDTPDQVQASTKIKKLRSAVISN